MKEIFVSLKRTLRFSLSNAWWLMVNYIGLRRTLIDKKVENVKVYKFSRWHVGFCYFVGTLEECKVFIKVCRGVYNTVPAESNMLKYEDFYYCPKVKAYNLGRYSWIATKYMEIKPLYKMHANEFTEDLINQAVNILDSLYAYGIIHRDLNLENVCLDKNGKLLLIDFGWALYREFDFKETEYTFIEKTLNLDYRGENNNFDDAVSLFLIFKELLYKFNLKVSLHNIKRRIGRLEKIV